MTITVLSANAKISEIPQETGGVKWTLICDGKKKGFKTEKFTVNPQQGYEQVDLVKTPIGNLFVCRQKKTFHLYNLDGEYLCLVNTQKADNITIDSQWEKSHKVHGNERILYLETRSKNWNEKGVVQVVYNSSLNSYSAKEIIPTEYFILEEWNGWWWGYNDSKHAGKLISIDGNKILPKDNWIKPYELKNVLGCFKIGDALYDKDGAYIKGHVRHAYVREEDDFNFIKVELEDGRQGIIDGNGKQIVDFVDCSVIVYEGNGEFRIAEKTRSKPSKTTHYDPWGWYGTPMYNNMWSTPYYWSGETYNYPTATSSPTTIEELDNRRRDNLNRVVGEDCLTCHGSGKCPTCNRTKITSSMGNTYKCNVCDDHGNCPSCHGTGKTSWNR